MKVYYMEGVHGINLFHLPKEDLLKQEETLLKYWAM